MSYVDKLAKEGDIAGAKAFAAENPEAASLLGDAFATHQPGLKHVLREEVPSAFASPTPDIVDQKTNQQVTANVIAGPPDPGGGVPTEPPVIVTAPAPPWPPPVSSCTAAFRW